MLPVDGLAKDPPSAEAMLNAVRRSSTSSEDLKMKGLLRQDRADLTRVKEPFVVEMNGPRIAFHFTKGDKQSIVMDLANDGFLLQESSNGEAYAAVPEAKYAQSVRGMDANYEDISLAYLYWPDPEYLGEDRVGERLAYKVRVTNPKKEGPYRYMLVWVDQDFGALLRMRGYNADDQMMKQMEVMDVMKIKEKGKPDTWMVKKLQMVSVDPKTKATQKTYMEFEKP